MTKALAVLFFFLSGTYFLYVAAIVKAGYGFLAAAILVAGITQIVMSIGLIAREGWAMLKTQEHYDLIAQFERDTKPGRLDKESKELWSLGRIYQDGRVNELFLVYRSGYAFGKCLWQQPSAA